MKGKFALAALLGFSVVSFTSSAQQKGCATRQINVTTKKSLHVNHLDTSGRGMADNYYLWKPGQTLKVKFLSGSKALQDRVKAAANEWTQFANIKFQYVTTGDANIRIKLNNDDGHWSYIGSFNDLIDQRHHTMNLDTVDLANPLALRGTVLHEFGHALGLLHEHSSPQSGIQWNVPHIYGEYEKMYGWNKDDVDYQVMRVLNYSYTNGTAYDNKSIMHYPIFSWETKNRYTVPWNRELSAGDRSLIAALYPKKGKRTNEVARAYVTNYKGVAIQNQILRNGISIFPSFDLTGANMAGTIHIVAEIYDEFNYPIPDSDDLYSFEGVVAGIRTVRTIAGRKTSYNQGKTKNLEIFIPFDQLELFDDEKIIKVLLRVVQETPEGEIKEIYHSKGTQFSFSKKNFTR